MDSVAKQNQNKVEPAEGIVKMKIEEQGKIVKIRIQMEESVKKELIEFLHNNYDVMAYSLVEIKGVSRDVIKHRLNMRKEVNVVKQRKKNVASKRQ